MKLIDPASPILSVSVAPGTGAHATPLTVDLSGVNFAYGVGENRKQVLFDNDLAIEPGKIVIITGPSGSGKTTLLTLIGALRSPQSGSVKVLGRELSGLDSRGQEAVRREIGFIFQTHHLFEALTARQTLALAMHLHEYSTRERTERPERILSELGMAEHMDRKPGKLSVGQCQRVAIGRALVNNPKLILADEPTAALDKDTGRLVVNVLRRHAQEQGCTIVIVTHDPRIVDVADRVVHMVDGQIVSARAQPGSI
jgi:putative ABC transport system ATP-binding protein